MTSIDRSEPPGDLFDHEAGDRLDLSFTGSAPSRRRGRPRKKLGGQLPELPSPGVSTAVTDDWPERVPISERELRIHETHLAEVLDRLLGPLS